MKTYIGYRIREKASTGVDEVTTKRCVVFVQTEGNSTDGKRSFTKKKRPLRPRNDIRNHSPDGFEWGYGGSGPAQLALALVADCCGRELAHPAIYQRVKAEIVARLPQDGWTLTEQQIKDAVAIAVHERNLRDQANIRGDETP